jgi:hypothetical protein
LERNCDVCWNVDVKGGRVARGLVALTAVVAALAATAADARAACAPAATRAAFASFVSAYNRGDTARLDALFAGPPAFQWYSSNAPGLRRTAAAKNRGSLTAYFRARHLKRDRLRLVRFTFTGNDAGGYGNFVFRLKRSAADYRKGAPFGLIGKGAAVCSEDPSTKPAQLVIVSLGGPGSDRR